MNTEQFDGHTPGPWDAECVSDEVRAYDILIWADDSVRYFVTLEEDADRRVIEPDARLIAAAPDLLAEVKRLRRLNDYLWEHRSSHWSADDDAEMDRLEMME